MHYIKKGRDPIAIIGIGCRFPGGANSPEEFWNILLNGTDAITRIPPDRWNADALYNPDYTKKGKINVREGGFVTDIDKIDAGFFEIPPIEAKRLDPQQRLLLEVTYQAIEDAGLKLENLSGSKTGVFIGISSHDYSEITTTHTERANIGGSTNLGNAGSIASNRISYILYNKLVNPPGADAKIDIVFYPGKKTILFLIIKTGRQDFFILPGRHYFCILSPYFNSSAFYFCLPASANFRAGV